MTRDDKHTAGPWHVESGLSEHSSSLDIYSASNLWVGDVQGCHSKTLPCGCKQHVEGFPTDEEAVANACLIKEAPMMLEALRWIADGGDLASFALRDIARQAIGLATDQLIREVEKK